MTSVGGSTSAERPRRPLSAIQLARLAVVVQGRATTESGQIWVVMYGDPPEVVGSSDSEQAAEEMLARSSREYGTECDIYGPFETSSARVLSSALVVTDHDGGCQCDLCPIASTTGRSPTGLTSQDIVWVKLEIGWKPGGRTDPDDTSAPNSVTYTIRPNADAIFLNQGGREGFVYTRYHTKYDTTYEDKLRKKFKEPR